MSDLLEQLNKANSIPSPPGVALEIIRLNRRDDIDIDELAEAVTRDPAIVAKLLRMANSSSFGRPGRVSDIRQAIMTLGLRSVNLLALSFSLASCSRNDAEGHFDYKRYWTASAVMTTASEILAEQHLAHFSDEAFLVSILCDFGQLILTEGAAERYEQVLGRVAETNEPLEVVEREILGGDHAEIGGQLLRSWGLPPLICSAIEHHHDTDLEAIADHDTRSLARVLRVAGLIGEIYAGGDIHSGLKQLKAAASECFDLSSSECQELLGSTAVRVGETIEMLDLECSDPDEIAEIRVRATEHLVKQSLALNQQIEAVSADSAELKKRNDDLEERATTDALTGLRNRGYFDEWLESECQRARQEGHALGLLLLDIDHFKSVNDDHGHQCGDELLKVVTSAIGRAAGPDNIVCRYGGEEITVIAPECDADKLESLAQRLRAAVAQTSVTRQDKQIRRTVSIGGYASRAGQAPPTPQRMMEMTDAELYRAKSAGRDRVFVTRD